MNKMTFTGTRTAALAVLLLAAAGCEKAPEPETATHPAAAPDQTAAQRRMSDPKYVKKLHKRHEERQELLKEILDVERRLAAAKAAEPVDAALVGRLEELLKDRQNILAKHEIESRRIVARQIRGDLKEQDNLKSKKGE